MPAGSQNAVAERLALVNGRLIDGTDRPPVAGATVVIEHGRIARVDAHPPPPAAHVIDLEGRTLLPGLIDAHVHLSSLPGIPPRLRCYGLVQACRALVVAGVTTVRDLGAYGDSLFDLRHALNSGLCVGPRLVLSGQVISAVCAGAKRFPGMYREATGADGIRLAVREQVSAGADVVKVMATGALTVPEEDVGPSQLTGSELGALVDEAHRLGLPVASHAEGAAGIRLSVEAGTDTIEHGEEGHLVPDALGMMAVRRTVLVPTLSVFDMVADSEELPTATRQRAKRLGEAAMLTVQSALREGVPIAMGADAPPHGDNARELVRLVEAGLSPQAAIAAATSISASACGLERELGTVEIGKVADLLVADGDPLSDPGVLADPSRIWLVIQGGRPVARNGRLVGVEREDHDFAVSVEERHLSGDSGSSRPLTESTVASFPGIDFSAELRESDRGRR